ncbi:hypothetical protein [Rhodococcus opacus]|uniref:Uncharacterized protein n=1 Tax=Rhodococcus opacus (strain B4) TaxID=632772 RepID=C1B9D2_RHOOB|nr:hypothetical protein [Rhodococcus opacus]BAH52285.1 hypothetical protein ROP_40380 [Rhodococcus opacus B4]
MARSRFGRWLSKWFSVQQQRIVQETVTDLHAVWPLLDYQDLDRTQTRWVQAALPIVERRNQESEALAARYVRDLRAIELPTATPARDLVPTEIDRPRVAVSLLATGPGTVKKKSRVSVREPEAMLAGEAASTRVAQKIVADGGRQTVARAVRLDEKASGWIRVTDGEPCFFCAMLVTRGPVYKGTSFDRSDPRFTGDGTAKVHDGCGCTIQALYSPWKPSEQEKVWNEMWKDSTKNKSGADALKAFRQAYEDRTPPPNPLDELGDPRGFVPELEASLRDLLFEHLLDPSSPQVRWHMETIKRLKSGKF